MPSLWTEGLRLRLRDGLHVRVVSEGLQDGRSLAMAEPTAKARLTPTWLPICTGRAGLFTVGVVSTWHDKPVLLLSH